MVIRGLLMKLVILCLLAFSQMALALDAELECELERGGKSINLVTIETRILVNCDFIKTGTVCDYEEGNDQFTAMAFEPAVIQSAKPGDQISGSYLSGYVWKTWVVDSEEPMTCLVK